MNVPAICLEKVERRYDQAGSPLEVLRGADFCLWAGQSVALVAPSGAGKSTLLHVAGLLERPDGGEVFIAGGATVAMTDEARTTLRRNEIGFVYQFHHLLPEFTALENVMLPQMIAGLSRARAKERAWQLLHYLGLSGRADHRPPELSGGEQQRVAIARAVANGPGILLADEPTGNLDEDRRSCFRGPLWTHPGDGPCCLDRHPQHGACRPHGPARHPARGAGAGVGLITRRRYSTNCHLRPSDPDGLCPGLSQPIRGHPQKDCTDIVRGQEAYRLSPR